MTEDLKALDAELSAHLAEQADGAELWAQLDTATAAVGQDGYTDIEREYLRHGIVTMGDTPLGLMPVVVRLADVLRIVREFNAGSLGEIGGESE